MCSNLFLRFIATKALFSPRNTLRKSRSHFMFVFVGWYEMTVDRETKIQSVIKLTCSVCWLCCCLIRNELKINHFCYQTGFFGSRSCFWGGRKRGAFSFVLLSRQKVKTLSIKFDTEIIDFLWEWKRKASVNSPSNSGVDRSSSSELLNDLCWGR